MVEQILTGSAELDSAIELAIVPIDIIGAQVTVTLAAGVEGQQVWVKVLGDAGANNVFIAVQSPDVLEADTGLETLNSHGASRLLYFRDGCWTFLTYM